MQVEQGSPAVIWAHFLKLSGEEATITGTPTISIRHYQVNTSSLDTDVNAQNMTQASGTLYYYVWGYVDIVKTSYAATVSATYNTGENVTGSQSFTIKTKKHSFAPIWTFEEKQKMLVFVDDISKILRKMSKDNKVIDELSQLEINLRELINKPRELKNEEEIKNRLNLVNGKLDNIDKETQLQNKVLLKIADLKSIEELLKEGGKI